MMKSDPPSRFVMCLVATVAMVACSPAPEAQPPSPTARPASAAAATSAAMTPTALASAASATSAAEPSPTPARPTVAIERMANLPPAVHGMAVDASGRVFFSDSFAKLDKTRRIYELEPPYTGEPTATELVFELPAGLMFEGDTMFVCDVTAKKVVQLDASRQVQRTWPNVAVWNLARVGDTLVAVTTTDSVVALKPNGSHAVLFAGAAAPFGIAAAGDDALWLSEQGAKPGDPGRVTARRTDGSVARTIDYDWQNPEGLAVGPDGRLWVAETERGELLAIDDQGAVQVMHTSAFPIAISTGPDGSLFVTTKTELLRVSLQK